MEIVKIKLSLSNAYLVKDRQTILVDTGSPHEADRILAAAQAAGVQPGDIRLILHTHGHVDHAGSTAELQRRLKIPSAVHAAEAVKLRTGVNGPVTAVGLEARLIKPFVVKPFEPSQPDILIQEEISLNDFGVDGRVIFTPGHTAGSLSIVFNRQAAIIGDVLMGGRLGGNLFGARPNYHYFMDDLPAIHASLKKIIGWQPARLYVGHGGPLALEAVIGRFPEATSE